MTNKNRFAHALLPALLVVAAICGQPTHAAPSGDADLRELSRYELTMTDMRKFAAANANLAKTERNEDDEGGSDKESLDDMAARIAKIPEARKAIEAAGLTPRQYAVITMALFQAAFAQYAVDQGADPAKVARDAGVNPANLRFVKEHKQELEKLKGPSGDE
ncbi:MAG TPA: hypothetical protein VMF52_03345 [Steroidobacteraceae bacterium]|nr:hypothetical protein [Steroidobacteraceae bacterium]